MAQSKFVAPRTLTNLEQASKALRDVQEALDALSLGMYQLGLQTTDFSPLSPSYTRASPPVGGLRVVLPRPAPANGGQPITIAIENPQGNLVVFASNGTLVNGAATATLSAAGIVTFISNGVDQWASTAQLPGPAGVPTVASAGLQGPPGMDGYDGVEGERGPPGIDGRQGVDGAPGALGVLQADFYDQGEPFIIPGPAGSNGAAGADGQQGPMGRPGEDGADGRDGFDGAPGPAGSQGIQGVAGANGTPSIIQADVYDQGEGFIIPGPAGTNGAAGTNGSVGPQGPPGPGSTDLSYDMGEPIHGGGGFCTAQVGILVQRNGVTIAGGPHSVVNLTQSTGMLLGQTGTAGTASVSFAVDVTAAFAWSGTHSWSNTATFTGPVVGTGISSQTLAATTNDLAIGSVNCLRLTLTGSQTLNGIVPTTDGQWLFLENVDTVDGLTLGHDDAGSTAANRIYCPQAQPFFVGARCGVWMRYDGTLARWVLAYTKAYFGMSIRDGASLLTGNAVFEVIRGNGIAIATSQTGAAPLAETDITWSVDEAASFTWTGTHLWAEKAASPAVGAGNGQWWVKNDSPNRPVFTDDIEDDWMLGFAAQNILVTNQSAAALTTLLSCTTMSSTAGSLRAGSIFRWVAYFVFVHAAGATPAVRAELLIDGVTIPVTIDVTPNGTASTYAGSVEAYMVVRSIGAGGTAMFDIQTFNNVGASDIFALNGSINTAATALDTTVSHTMELRMRMTSAVAANTLTVTRAFNQRVA